MIIGGCCLSLLQFLFRLLKVKQLVRAATPVSDAQLLNAQQQTVITEHHIRVLTTDEKISPLVFGFFQLHLLLPRGVFSMPERQRQLLIEHELTHIKRQDPRAVILFRLCSCLFWFNPFIGYFEKRFLQSMELNCDNQVLSRFPEAKLHYAKALIASLKFSTTRDNNGVTTYFSGPSLKKQDFENRIKMAMSTPPGKQYGLSYRLALVFLSLAIGSFAIAAKSFLPMQAFKDNNLNGILPVVAGRISSDYEDINAFRGNRPHKAIDFAAPTGTQVIASFSGKVLIADDTTLHRNYGKVVLIEHEGQLQSLYAHLDSFAVESGQYVVAGQKLGTVGETGRTTGPHLHFEMLKAGQRANPRLYLNFDANQH